MAAAACASEPELKRLLRGELSQAEADTLEQHLDRCLPCRRALQGLDAPDPLLEIVRAVVTKPLPPIEAGVDRLIARLVALSLPATQTGETTGGERSAPGAVDVTALLAPPQLPGELGRLGPYRVLAVLGSGGMGVVFKAEDPHLGRLLALKVIGPRLAASAKARQRFLREARAAAAVEHDHIVSLYHAGEEHGVPFLAFPLLKGETLDTRLKRQDRLPAAEVLRIGREIAEGLAAAHAQGLIHRDIKPANIWLEARPGGNPAGERVRILDFGLARAVSEAQEALDEMETPAHHGPAALTHAGTFVGTPAYSAPEQLRGAPVDARADLFSLGAVLYRMATGRAPFSGTEVTAVLASLERDQPAPPRTLNRQVPARLSTLILQLLAKEPAQRPSSAQAVAEALAVLSLDRRRRWTMTAAGFLAGLLLLAGYLFLPHRGEPELAPQTHEPDVVVAGVDFVPASSYDAGLNPVASAAGDVNGDGMLDLVVSNMGQRQPLPASQGTVSVLLGNGDGTFRPAVNYDAGLQPHRVVLADLDGDGHLDVAVANNWGHNLSVLLGNGDGTFHTAVAYPLAPHPTYVVAGDFNRDGRMDLAVAHNFREGGVSILLGKGAGTFLAPAFYATGSVSGPVAAADVDGDGQLDLIVSNFLSGTLSVLLGKRDGTFHAPRQRRFDEPYLRAVADLDGDGKLDLAVSSSRPAKLQLLLGNGDGTFREGAHLSFPDVWQAAAASDFNNDGRADLVYLSQEEGRTTLHALLGKGGGSFMTRRAINLDFSGGDVVVGDFNGDGRPDLAITNPASGSARGKVWVLLNQPAAERFAIANVQAVAGRPTYITVVTQDAVGNTAVGYAGTARITCAGEQQGLPAEYTFVAQDHGTHAFDSVVFSNPGQYAVTITDTANPTLQASGTVTVSSKK